MNITSNNTEELGTDLEESPGKQLARLREQRGYSQEFVAGKLHLRVRVIDLLETDNYELLPEPVFIKGYMRAYAKLLCVPYEPFLAFFNNLNIADRKVEKALWQGRRETKTKDKMVRWLSLISVSLVILLSAFWWQRNKDSPLISTVEQTTIKKMTTVREKPEEKLTSLSKMQSMFTKKLELAWPEKQNG